MLRTTTEATTQFIPQHAGIQPTDSSEGSRAAEAAREQDQAADAHMTLEQARQRVRTAIGDARAAPGQAAVIFTELAEALDRVRNTHTKVWTLDDAVAGLRDLQQDGALTEKETRRLIDEVIKPRMGLLGVLRKFAGWEMGAFSSTSHNRAVASQISDYVDEFSQIQNPADRSWLLAQLSDSASALAGQGVISADENRAAQALIVQAQRQEAPAAAAPSDSSTEHKH